MSQHQHQLDADAAIAVPRDHRFPVSQPVVLVSSAMFSVATVALKSKRANKRAKRMRVYAGAEMNT